MNVAVLRRRQRGGAVSLAAQVQAILAGTTGFAIDPTDVTTLFQGTDTATPVVSASDPVRRINSKWGTAHVFLAPSDAARGAWDGTQFITMDGSDDYYEASAASDVFRNAPGYFVAMRRGGSYNNNGIVAVSTATTTTHRCVVQGSSGRMRTQVRRLDADSTTDDFGAAAAFNGSTWSFEQDLSINGNAVKRKDNATVDTYTLAGTPANSENTASSRVRLGGLLGAFFQTGSIGRTVFFPFVPSVAQRDLIEAWLVEV